MSGGFFRGTSAAQDTRFSNKQAKLLKSQKFAPELEHPVDMTKVKMDVMRPWIANRVTELIGFEDEVLINFIYGLLDGKEVNGKEIQISLTGFMERNTGKFMKELWALLLSAQKNASGVPQQFLDAKEEEAKKKKLETDRIANEIQRKREKESRELEQERNKKMDAGNDNLKDMDAGTEPSSKYHHRASHMMSAEEKVFKERNGSRGRIRVSKSPHSADHSSSPRGKRSRSNSKSFSNSRSHSDERRQRSLSTSPKRRGRSSSSERVRRSPPKRSLTPRRRHSPRRSHTPPRRKSYYSRRSRNRSPSPPWYRLRSPLRRGLRSPPWHRSRSPIRLRSRSPIRRSPVRPRSPSLRRRSPSPIRRRSPSPMWHRSRSPMRRRYRRSPSTPRRRSPSPIRRRSPLLNRRRSPSPVHHKSPSAQDWSSPSPVRRRSPSPIRRKSPRRQRTPVRSLGERIRNRVNQSPRRRASPGASGELPADARKRSLERHSRSDSRERNDSPRKVKELSPSPCRSLVSEGEREMSPSEKRRLSSPSRSPLNGNRQKRIRSYSPSPPRKPRENKLHHDSSERSADDKDTNYSREADKRKYESPIKNSKTSDRHNNSQGKSHFDYELSPYQRLSGHHPGRSESNKKDEVLKSGNKFGKTDHLKKPAQQDPQMVRDVVSSERERELRVGEGRRIVEKNQPRSNDIKITDQRLEALPKLSKKIKQNDESGSSSEESDKIRTDVKEKRNNKRSVRRGLDSDDESSYDSYEEERKEAKRRKEEKRLRKEKRRRRREERRRKREERRAERQKLKSDTVSTPSDTEKYYDDRSDDDQHARRHKSCGSDAAENASEQKKLEIELREKALESLRAKKGIGH